MVIRKFTKKECIIMALLYVMLVLHGTNIIGFSQMSIALPMTAIVLIISSRYRCKLTIELFFVFGLLLMNYVVTGVISSASLSEGFNFSGFLEIVFVVFTTRLLYKLDDDVMTKFIKMVYFFACVSLVFYLLISIGAGNIVASVFPIYHTGMGNVSGRLVYVYNLKNPDRNAGIFTEPGIFQTVLIMCIYVILFMQERTSLTKKKATRYLLVFLVTLITTKSAAGYIGLFTVIIGILLKRKEKRDYAIVGVLVLGIVYLLYNYCTKGNDSILQRYFIGKLVETQTRDITLSSGGARLVAMQMGWNAAVAHPFGIGYLNWEKQLFEIYGHKFGTGNALFTELGTRGFISFFLTIFLVIKPAFIRKKGWLEFLIFCVLFTYISMVQAKILYPAIILVAYLAERTNNIPKNQEK